MSLSKCISTVILFSIALGLGIGVVESDETPKKDRSFWKAVVIGLYVVFDLISLASFVLGF